MTALPVTGAPDGNNSTQGDRLSAGHGAPAFGRGMTAPDALDDDPMYGKTLAGRFTIHGRLGAGSMGTVYRASQDAVGREVAIKILRSDRAIDEQSKARFLREARANSVLTSPHTVTVFDFGESENGELFLAMEMLIGESLGQRLARVGRLGARESVEVVRQALRSLDEAHAKGIVHRDLKPDNLFFARVESGAVDGEEIVKVLDFGIAKMLRDEDRRLNAVETQAGTVFGTPRFMSPEQAQGKQLDARSDLYSLGVILYTMLTGSPPFTDEDAILVMARHIKTLPVPLRTAAPDALIPESLDRLVMRVLSKSPDDRPESADAMAIELLHALESLPSTDSGVRSRVNESMRTGAATADTYLHGTPEFHDGQPTDPRGPGAGASTSTPWGRQPRPSQLRAPVLVGLLLGVLVVLLIAIAMMLKSRMDSGTDSPQVRTVGVTAPVPTLSIRGAELPANVVVPAELPALKADELPPSTPVAPLHSNGTTKIRLNASAIPVPASSAAHPIAAPRPSGTYESFEHL